MAKKETINICLDDLFAASKAGHPAFKKGNNGKTYAAVQVWFNDEPDKYGNDISASVYDGEAKKATYIGNGKSASQWAAKDQKQQPKPVQYDNNDLPY